MLMEEKSSFGYKALAWQSESSKPSLYETPSSAKRASESRYSSTAASLAWRTSFSLSSRVFFSSSVNFWNSSLAYSASLSFCSVTSFQFLSSNSSSFASLAFSRTRPRAVLWWRDRSINRFFMSMAWRRKGVKFKQENIRRQRYDRPLPGQC